MNKNRMKLSEIAYNEIKKRLLNLTIKPGDPVSDKELGEDLGIGRTPIREALTRLENENLVKFFPKRGIFATTIYKTEILDLYSIRLLIEPYAARLATNYIDLTELDYYYDLWKNPDYNNEIELNEHISIDNNFHRLIANNSRNQYLIAILSNFSDHVYRIRNYTKEYSFLRSDKSRLEHIEIIDLIRNREARCVEESLKKHIQNILGFLEDFNKNI